MNKVITVECDGHRTEPWVVKANGRVVYRTCNEENARQTANNPLVIQQINAGD